MFRTGAPHPTKRAVNPSGQKCSRAVTPNQFIRLQGHIYAYHFMLSDTFLFVVSCYQLLSSAYRAFFLTDFLEAARYTFVFPADRLPCLRTKSVRSLMTDPVRK